jgi:hypothetical protein
MPRSKSATLNLRIDPDIKDAAETAAANDRRSLTSLVEKLLIDYLRKRGLWGEALERSDRTQDRPQPVKVYGRKSMRRVKE